jgi:hypothetical protein
MIKADGRRMEEGWKKDGRRMEEGRSRVRLQEADEK